VDRLETLDTAGKYAQGLSEAGPLLAEVERLDFAPLRARALFQLASLRRGAGEYKEAEARVRRAIPLAASGGDVVTLAKAWNLLTFVLAEHQSRPQEALGMELALESAVRLARDNELRAASHINLGIIFDLLGRYEESRVHYEQALAVREKVLGDEHPMMLIRNPEEDAGPRAPRCRLLA
jgi:serine/threonine-protein kinase